MSENIREKVGRILLESKNETVAIKALSKELSNSPEAIDVFLLKLGITLVTKFYRQVMWSIRKGGYDAEELHMPESGDHTH